MHAFPPFLLHHQKGWASHSREINFFSKRCAGFPINSILRWRRGVTPSPWHTHPHQPTAQKRLFFLRQPHTVTIPGLCGRRLLFSCVCQPGRLQPLINKRYRWLEHEREISGWFNKQKQTIFSLHWCVSWNRLYLENRFGPNGSLEEWGSVPGLSVYYNAAIKNNSLAP